MIDLINRLQAEKEALIAGQETLQKALAEKIAEIESLRLKNENLKYAADVITEYLWDKDTITRAQVRKEAIKEFMNELEEYKCVLLDEKPTGKVWFVYEDSPSHIGVEAVAFSDIKYVAKLMVGEDL